MQTVSPQNPPLQGLNSTSQYLTLLSTHISFSLLLTSTLLLSNASLKSCLGKIPMTTTSPSLSAFSLCIISSYFFVISSVSSIRRLFVSTCTITVSSLLDLWNHLLNFSSRLTHSAKPHTLLL